jgi:hypothetical protein
MKNEMGGAWGTYVGEDKCVLLGSPKGRKPIGRPRLRWEDNINMDLTEM